MSFLNLKDRHVHKLSCICTFLPFYFLNIPVSEYTVCFIRVLFEIEQVFLNIVSSKSF